MSKVSLYNHFQQWRDGLYIAFNARTGAVALMSDAHYAMYTGLAEKMSGGNAAPDLSAAEQELLKQLEYGSFMYPDDRDEFRTLQFQHDVVKHDRTALSLIIAPTLACNMACPYCYEKSKHGKMASAVVADILKFVDDRSASLNRVDVTWYGGEPLLALDVIEEVSSALMQRGREKDFRFLTAIVTNGFLLTAETVDKLVGWNAQLCQVTLDGPARFHNQKRPLKNGRESFQTIIDNLKYASTRLLVSIRVNVDQTYNADVVSELLTELEAAGLRDKIAIYFGQLEPASSACMAIADTCYDNADFSAAVVDYYRLLLDRGFRIENLPRPTATYCMSHRMNALLVDPDGFLYRCWNYVGDQTRSMGNIRNALDYGHPNFSKLFNCDPFADDLCRECKVLPICMGGCPAQRVDRGFVGEQACQSWKHNLLPMLEIIARSRQQKAQPPQKERV